jgi:hypothetical protein
VTLAPERLGWMAAVIDLKGLPIRKANKTRATPQLVLVVESKHVNVIRRLSEMTGTEVERKNQRNLGEGWMRRGCVEHCPEPHFHQHSEEHRWQMPDTQRWSITGVGAAIVLHNLMPYLTDTTEYEEFAALAVTNAALTGQGSGAARAAISRLMRLGWELPPLLAEKLLTATV